MRNFLLFLLLLPMLGISQNNKYSLLKAENHPIDMVKCRSQFNLGVQVEPNDGAVKQFAENFVSRALNKQYTLELTHKVESPMGIHYLYQQAFEGIEIYRGQIKVNLDKQGNITSLFDNTFEVEANSTVFPAQEIAETWKQENYPKAEDIGKFEAGLIWFFTGLEFIPSLHIEVADHHDKYFEVVLDAQGNNVYERDLNRYFHSSSAVDTPATTMVFLPDPLTTANQPYGAPYADNNDSDVAQLNAERVSVNIDVTYQGGQFILESPYCKVSEHSSPNIPPVTKTTPVFEYTRSESGFEDVNVFYHINAYQNYVRSLGFTNLASYPIDIDTHGWNGQDNSNFNPGFSTPRLTFGEGGVDDAEDADVIIHEYGHALSHSAAPSTNNGVERQALDEAVGDYLCSSYSRSIDPYHWEYVFGWDGHNEFWNGRLSTSSDHYPEDLDNNLYLDADIWSATIMQIWGDVGREVADALQLQALYGYASGMSMEDAAYLYLQADGDIYGGAHAYSILYWMITRGLLPPELGVNDVSPSNDIRLFNSEGFATGSSQAWIEFPTNKAVVSIYDVTGKLLANEQVAGNKYYLNASGFLAGVYLISAEQDGLRRSFKVVRR